MLFVRRPRHRSARRTARQGVLVRDRSYEIPGGVRITAGTREQIRRVLDELEQIW